MPSLRRIITVLESPLPKVAALAYRYFVE